MRPDVGAVGARLYYEDDTIQHAGVVIGFGGVAGHCFVQQKRNETGYCHRIICAQDYSAVTAACMLVKKEAFEKVGGLSEALQVAFNDIDFCLKLQKAGYLVVYNPYAELYHYESKSRGLEDTPEKVARFNREIAVFEKRWPEILKNGDPYYNPNLTLDSQDFFAEKNMRNKMIRYFTMKKKQYVPEILFLAVLFCFIFLWAVVQPLNVSPDEHMRYQIVEYIMKHGTLPEGGDPEIRNELWGISYAFSPITSYMIEPSSEKLRRFSLRRNWRRLSEPAW